MSTSRLEPMRIIYALILLTSILVIGLIYESSRPASYPVTAYVTNTTTAYVTNTQTPMGTVTQQVTFNTTSTETTTIVFITNSVPSFWYTCQPDQSYSYATPIMCRGTIYTYGGSGNCGSLEYTRENGVISRLFYFTLVDIPTSYFFFRIK